MKNLNRILNTINLRLFDGEAMDNDSESNSDAEVIYGKEILDNQVNDNADEEVEKEDKNSESENDTERNFDEEFEKLIKGDYKKQYDERVHKNIAGKVAANNKLKAQIDSYAPLTKFLSMKYGIVDATPEALLNAVRGDTASFEKEADEKNMTVEELMHLKQIEAENQEFRRLEKEAQEKEIITRQVTEWRNQAELFSAKNPAFDMNQEMQNSRFIDLLKANVDVETAYNVIHMNDIVTSAQKVSEKNVIDRVKSRNSRPDELSNGLTSKVKVKNDPSKFTDEDLEKIRQLVAEGKQIYL